MTKNAKMAAGTVAVIIVIVAVVFALMHKSPSSSSQANMQPAASQGKSKPAAGNSIVLTKTSPSLGQYLTDPSGKALYFYNADSTNMSNCTGSCLANWPAYTANSTAASLPAGITTFKRADNGGMQYSYNGKPLYYFASDRNGQVTGDGVENFTLAKPVVSVQQNSNSQNQPATNSNSSGYPY